MTEDQSERLVKAVEVVAITVAHLGTAWLALHMSDRRADWLADHVEPRLDWRLQRFGS